MALDEELSIRIYRDMIRTKTLDLEMGRSDPDLQESS